jgi:hypothetical protein
MNNAINLIKTLENEEQELLKKIEKARDNNDFGTYKNLIRVLTDVTTLKQNEIKTNKISNKEKSYALLDYKNYVSISDVEVLTTPIFKNGKLISYIGVVRFTIDNFLNELDDIKEIAHKFDLIIFKTKNDIITEKCIIKNCKIDIDKVSKKEFKYCLECNFDVTDITIENDDSDMNFITNQILKTFNNDYNISYGSYSSENPISMVLINKQNDNKIKITISKE